ncbi:hypothetical protein [Streptomyces jumonjinensis]|uniref:hypothetical protein n=1 Tax=Streptomyces jumonjinensis TaxID=1945 RepID=UPI003795CA99
MGTGTRHGRYRHAKAHRRTEAARALQRAEGIPYQDALNRVRATASEPAVEPPALEPAAPPAVAYVLQPTAAEAALGITAEALGVRALPADATPAQRAHAEAVWRPQEDPAQPCRCSGTGCHHGKPCTGHDGCTGRLVHIDRYPGSLWGVTTWMDTYACSDYEEGFEVVVELPAIPWGEHYTTDTGPGTRVYDGVRHPNFSGAAEDDEGELDPAHYATPEDDYDEYDDEGQEHEAPRHPKDDPESRFDHWDDDPRDDSPGDPPDEYDEHQDHEHDGAPSLVPALDLDPQPTADTWPEPHQW